MLQKTGFGLLRLEVYSLLLNFSSVNNEVPRIVRWWLVPTSSQHVLDAGIGLGKEATLCIFSDQHQHKSREEKKRSLWKWNSYKTQHTILYYFILSSGPLLPQLLPACCSHSAVFIQWRRDMWWCSFAELAQFRITPMSFHFPHHLTFLKMTPA